MSNSGYCPNCQKTVYGKMDINLLILVILLILGVVFGVVYLVYCVTKPEVCPYCRNVLEPNPPIASTAARRRPSSACLGCGMLLNGERFCPNCGRENHNASEDGDYSHTVDVSFAFDSPTNTDTGKKVMNCYVEIDGVKVARSEGPMCRRLITTNGEHKVGFFSNSGSFINNQTAKIEETFDIREGTRIWITYTENKPEFHIEQPS